MNHIAYCIFLLVFGVLTSFSSYAHLGHTTVTCKENSCLKNGWSSEYFTHHQGEDWQGTLKTDVECIKNDCNKFGFNYKVHEVKEGYDVFFGKATCLEGGCFKEGWHAYVPQAGRTMRMDCIDGDCFKSGYYYKGFRMSYYSSNYTPWNFKTGCKDGDCSVNGWSRGSFNCDVTCTNGDCFKNGWGTYKHGGSPCHFLGF